MTWRKFLQSPEGQEGMLFLREKVPSVLSGESHAIIFGAGKAEGFKIALDTISELLTMREAIPDSDLENR